MMEKNNAAVGAVRLDEAYVPSEDIVAREIEGEIVIIPLVSNIGDIEDELYTLNETGQAIWRKLDGRRTLRGVAAELAGEFDAPLEVLEQDVLGLIGELASRRMVVRKD
jgi:hypothetical protein